ncbi:MAG TPA: Holliday junction branch migration protein RuvA [Candidatus Anaerobutyricum stercoripullorum]|uniref:Holliday junction branch migration complex subunit RuvA n=1 Tax=Candidatus Anaerobutyricum stercoripullorum TaxID=2838456 RepID=A0A9D1X4F1_9FIRM|nr:Holliday junction branch migration protein RuvA [Candidatus Anaerobutyricum stercoripullorum]
MKGTAVYADQECIIVDNRGVGYEIRTSSATCSEVRMGEEVTLYTYLYVREDMIALYGFLSREELRIFRLLLGVSGIGPRVAVSVLSTLKVEDLYYAVISEDTKSIARTPGIGPKGAKRLIIELKDKLDLSDLGLGEEEEESISTRESAGEDSQIMDAMEALIALGYSNGEAYRAVHKVPGAKDMDTETLLKEALKKMMTL